MTFTELLNITLGSVHIIQFINNHYLHQKQFVTVNFSNSLFANLYSYSNKEKKVITYKTIEASFSTNITIKLDYFLSRWGQLYEDKLLSLPTDI